MWLGNEHYKEPMYHIQLQRTNDLPVAKEWNKGKSTIVTHPDCLILLHINHLLIVYSINVKYWHLVIGHMHYQQHNSDATRYQCLTLMLKTINKWSMCDNMMACTNNEFTLVDQLKYLNSKQWKELLPKI